MGVIDKVKNFTYENGPHAHFWVQSPKVQQLWCPLVKAWVTSDVL